MKILNCHVENFGKLSDFSMDFREGCNIICSNNGSGKSTLAAFIRVMFYGFEGERKRKGLNERTFYNPWQGGVYGGELTFQVNEKTYMVTRLFGSKESEDKFELRDLETNSISTDFSQNIGRELFEIDSESFMRTVFITGSDIDTKTTGDINAKMGNLTDNTEDLTDYDGAALTIKDLLNKMDPNKKKGSIKQLKDRITQLESETLKEDDLVSKMDGIREKIRLEKEKISQLTKEKSDIEKTRKMTEKFREVSVLIDQYNAMEQRLEEAKSLAANARIKMNGFVPSRSQLDEMQDKCTEMAEAKFAAVTAKLDDREIEKFLRLQQKFNPRRGELCKEDFDKVKGRIEKLVTLRNKQRVVDLSQDDEELLANLQRVYGSSCNLEKETDQFESLYDQFIQNQRKIDEIEKKLFSRKEKLKKKSIKSMVLNAFVVIGVVLLCVSAFAFYNNDKSNGLWICVTAVLLEVLAWILKWREGRDRKKDWDRLERLRDSINEDKLHIDDMKSQLVKWSNVKDLNPKAVKEVFHNARIKADRFRVLEGKKAKADQAVSDAECMMMATEIAQFLNRWGVLEDEKSFSKSLESLEKSWCEYNLLKESLREFEHKKEVYFEKKNNLEADLTKMGIRPSNDMQKQINDMRELVYGYIHAQENMTRETERLKAFDEEYDVESLKNFLNVNWKKDLEEVDEKYDKNRQQILLAEKHIEELEGNINVLEGQKEVIKAVGDELLVLYRKKDEETKKYNLIKTTGEILANAKETLTARYSKPLKDSYDKYFKILSSLDGDDYYIDSSGNLTVKEQGMQRQVSSFSSGYRDMMGLCLRLAFVDVMYTEEKPPIILDDPFVNLDKEKVEAGKMLLEKISEVYQIIYLTCNEDRK